MFGRLFDQNFHPRGLHLSSPLVPLVAPRLGRVGLALHLTQHGDLWLREVSDLPEFGHLGLRPPCDTRASALAVTPGSTAKSRVLPLQGGALDPFSSIKQSSVASGATVCFSTFSSHIIADARGAKGSLSDVTRERENQNHFLRSPECSPLSTSLQGEQR